MDPLDSVQSPGDGQISDGLDEGELLENLRNAPIVSPQRSPRFLDVYYLQPSPDFFGWQFGFDTSLPPFPTDSVSPLHDLFTSSRVYVSLSSSVENHQAALRLQKVYKSFRTRRQIADFAILVEEIRSKKLDFAELKLSFISFFDIEKRETAVSRWPRARTLVAKVGISKDQRAQKLTLQHWLEAIDPRHRFGHNLHFYYDKWFDSKSKQPFFYWLDIGEGKEVNLERCPRFKLRQQCIKYLGPTERKAYEVAVQDGKFFYKQSGKLLDMRGWSQDAKWIFVLSTSKTLYVGQKHRGTFQHSSFLAGGATLSAGRLVVEDGILKAVWPHSGHYLPTEENFENFILFLEEHNVDLSIVQEWRQQLNRCSLEEERSVEIIIPSMDKKLDSRQLDQNNRYMWDLMFQKSGYKPFSGDMSCASICHSHMKNAMGTPERKCGTKREITIKDLQPLIGQKRADAAKILGVSVSTFKRHCRSNGIKWWNGGECSWAFELDPKHRERPGEKTTRSCKTPSITGQTETGNQVLDSIVEIEGNLQEQNNFQTDNVSKEVEVAVSEGDSKSSWPMLPCFDPASKQSVVTIKATYREDIIKFDLSLTSGIVELKEEVAKRLELESDSFKVKYQDEDQEWILIACDADFQGCLEFSSSLGNQSVRILVVDKVFNFGKS